MIVTFVIFVCFLRVFVGVAVFTSIHTTVIGADIPVFDTVAARSCSVSGIRSGILCSSFLWFSTKPKRQRSMKGDNMPVM